MVSREELYAEVSRGLASMFTDEYVAATRKEALKRGVKHYYTGKPCKRGHKTLRIAKGTCVECRKEDWQKDNEKRKGKPKTEAAKAAGRRYYLANKEEVKERAKAQDPKKQREYKDRYKAKNPELFKVHVNARRRRLREAQPDWLTKEQRMAIRETYALAQKMTENTGVQHEVDHIIPLHGKNISGLHVPWNLQVMPYMDNRRKNNKHS
jgi:hypothetical protein